MTEPKPVIKDRRRPVAEVVFRAPIEIPGVDLHVKRLVPGEAVGISGMTAPPIFFDPDYRCLSIGDYLYPMDGGLVLRMRFLKAAKGPAK